MNPRLSFRFLKLPAPWGLEFATESASHGSRLDPTAGFQIPAQRLFLIASDLNQGQNVRTGDPRNRDRRWNMFHNAPPPRGRHRGIFCSPISDRIESARASCEMVPPRYLTDQIWSLVGVWAPNVEMTTIISFNSSREEIAQRGRQLSDP